MQSIVTTYNPELSKSLELGHDDEIIDGFINRYNVSESEASEILAETKKWLWLAAESEKERGVGLSMDNPLMIIDEMWHNFILYTKHYHEFCMEKLNKFIHHIPTPSWEKKNHRLAIESNAEIEKQKEKSYDQLSFIYDKLGAETVMKWYEEYPTKYTPEYISSIKK